MEAVIDYFSGGKYSKALNDIAVAEEKAAVAEEKAAVAEEKAAVAEEKAAVAKEKAAVAKEKAAVAEEKAALAEDKVAFAKKKDRELIISLYNEKVALGIISHCTGLSIDEIEKIISNK
jgi:hypothetical protein